METRLHSFIDIFNSAFESNGELVQLKQIVIPMIQRDYAQGREDPDVGRIRRRFLDSLYKAVTEQPVTLDFIYGDIDENGILTPLDGQQRLTTLFLLHWYAAKKEHIPESDCSCLGRFSYETRYSARYFCERLVSFEPSFETPISKDIINQAWFPLDYLKDPTIRSMLVMLDAIDDRFQNVDGLWERLKGNAITFYFFPIQDMGLTDELYIKMNSRGKPLTAFEHFKAELERNIGKADPAIAKRIGRKIDCEWTDLLWTYRDSGSGTSDDNVTDDEFLRYFKFICDVICYHKGLSPQNRSNDEFDLLDLYFSPDQDDLTENVKFMGDYFDCWCNLKGYRSPAEFLDSFMSYQHEPGKIVVDSSRFQVDIFGECLRTYSDKSGRVRQFPLNRIVLLYAIVTYLLHQDEISEEQFRRRIRIVNNLIQNSEDEISDRANRNRMPAILSQTDSIIRTGDITGGGEPGFNANQIQEEREKSRYLSDHPEEAENLFSLEDDPMLKGQIGIVGLDHLDYGSRFRSLFSCSWDKIDCALMATGNYSQQERNGWRHQVASSRMQLAWDSLFHKSTNEGYERTQDVLIRLLSTHDTFSEEILQDISDGFLRNCEEQSLFPWEYYYVKYPVFRPGSYGKLYNEHADTEPYKCAVMLTRSYLSQNSYMPYLKEADPAHISRDAFGLNLTYDDGGYYIICQNSCYEIKRSREEVIGTIEIRQNDQGIDTEDRIIKLKEWLLHRKEVI